MRNLENDFDTWWCRNRDDYVATPLMQQCFAGGYQLAVARITHRIATIAITLVVILALASLSACQDRFRYPCMDATNWQKPECQRPACTVTQTCPDMLLKPEEIKGEVR